jgi:tetratricopeptide (TPR) repeat protein
MNSASIYYVLSRDNEALAALQQAAQIFPDNANLHLVTAQLFQSTNRLAEAEQEYLRAIRVQPGDASWFALARLYNAEHRYAEAVRCVKEAATYSQVAYDRYRSLGQLYISMNEFQSALAAFDRADHSSPFHDHSSDLGRKFSARLAAGRSRAYRGSNDLQQAVAQQELAVRLTPGGFFGVAHHGGTIYSPGKFDRRRLCQGKSRGPAIGPPSRSILESTAALICAPRPPHVTPAFMRGGQNSDSFQQVTHLAFFRL